LLFSDEKVGVRFNQI